MKRQKKELCKKYENFILLKLWAGSEQPATGHEESEAHVLNVSVAASTFIPQRVASAREEERESLWGRRITYWNKDGRVRESLLQYGQVLSEEVGK